MNLFSSFLDLYGLICEFFNFIFLGFYEKCEEFLWDDEG